MTRRHRRSRTSAASASILLAAALLVALSGCSAPDSAFVGTWGDQGDATKPSLILSADGTLAGTDGCDSLTGSWSESGGTATLRTRGSGQSSCIGPDSLWLGDAETARITDGRLVISSVRHVEIGTLPKTG